MPAFGNPALEWQRGRPSDDTIAVCDVSGFANAVTHTIARRMRGEPAFAFPLVTDPRRALLEALYFQLLTNVTADAALANLQAFANGQVQINGHPQSAAEAGVYAGPNSHAFRDLCAIADGVLFRSHYEAEIAARSCNYRSGRAHIYTPEDGSVPVPPDAPVEQTDTIAVWTGGTGAALVDCAKRAFAGIRLDAVFVDAGDPHAARTLASARVIVSLSDDPGTALALVRFERPLCAATHGAAEVIDNVRTFDVWNPLGAVDAVLVAIGGAPPVKRPEAAQRAQFRPQARTPYAGEAAPLVSVVMTVYDRLANLDENLARLAHQTYPNVEIVVVSNNGPRADEICAKYPNVRYIHREHNSGSAGAPRNDGIAAARGTYVTCLDDDDIYFPDHLESMVRICERGAKVAYSDFLIQIVEQREDGREHVLGYDLEKGDGITADELMVTNRLGYMTVFAHRDVYETLGAYRAQDSSDKIYGANEVELWLRMARHYVLAHADRPTTMYTIRKSWKGSLTATDHFFFADGYERMYELYPADGLPLVRERRAQHLAALRSTTAAPPREPRYPASVSS